MVVRRENEQVALGKFFLNFEWEIKSGMIKNDSQKFSHKHIFGKLLAKICLKL